jgi:hypothetical protein
MATLTVDTSEYQEGEFTAEELDSLQVGEQLAQEEAALLAGKFKDAEDLEQAYIELQRKLGDPYQREVEDEVEQEVEQEEEEEQETLDPSFLDRLWEESQDDYSEETLEALEKMDAADLAQMYLDYRDQIESSKVLSEENVSQLKGVVGGDESYDQLMAWAGETLNDQEIAMYDAVMDKGDPLACFFAVKALQYRYMDAAGYEGELITGKAPASNVQGFRSQAELVRAMSDPRYDNDPAYRADVAAKLEISDLNF